MDILSMKSLALSIPGIVMFVGALTYGLSNSKIAELGKMAFGAGLLALLLVLR